MKKNTLLLLAFLTLFSANIFAQTAYDLYVADMQVTSENKDDIAAAINALNDPERTASGTITYDPITDTLTLENATINANGYVNNGIRYIYEHSAWLTIKLVGENTINAADDGISYINIYRNNRKWKFNYKCKIWYFYL